MPVFKVVSECLTEASPPFIHDYFGRVIARETRQKVKGFLYYPKLELEFAKNGFFNHGCQIYYGFVQSRSRNWKN